MCTRYLRGREPLILAATFFLQLNISLLFDVNVLYCTFLSKISSSLL